jgi:hypothetical protein
MSQVILGYKTNPLYLYMDKCQFPIWSHNIDSRSIRFLYCMMENPITLFQLLSWRLELQSITPCQQIPWWPILMGKCQFPIWSHNTVSRSLRFLYCMMENPITLFKLLSWRLELQSINMVILLLCLSCFLPRQCSI